MPTNMTPEDRELLIEVKALLKSFNGSDKYIFAKTLQLLDGKNAQLGRTTGTKLGTAPDQKLGFWGVTPVVQPAAIAAPTGGTIIDIQARAVLVLLLTALHGTGQIG